MQRGVVLVQIAEGIAVDEPGITRERRSEPANALLDIGQRHQRAQQIALVQKAGPLLAVPTNNGPCVVQLSVELGGLPGVIPSGIR